MAGKPVNGSCQAGLPWAESLVACAHGVSWKNWDYCDFEFSIRKKEEGEHFYLLASLLLGSSVDPRDSNSLELPGCTGLSARKVLVIIPLCGCQRGPRAESERYSLQLKPEAVGITLLAASRWLPKQSLSKRWAKRIWGPAQGESSISLFPNHGLLIAAGS